MLNLFHKPKHGLHWREFLLFHIQEDSDLERNQFLLITQEKLFLCLVLWSWVAHLVLHYISVETWHSLNFFFSLIKNNESAILEIYPAFFSISPQLTLVLLLVKHVGEERHCVRTVIINREDQLASVVYQPLILLLTSSFLETGQSFSVSLRME